MEYTIITSTRGKKMVVESGHNYKYILAYTSSKNVERWRCSNKICPAKILIKDGKIIKKHGMLHINFYFKKMCYM